MQHMFVQMFAYKLSGSVFIQDNWLRITDYPPPSLTPVVWFP